MLGEVLLLSLFIALTSGFTTSYAAFSRSEFLIVTVAHSALAGLSVLYYISYIFGFQVSSMHEWLMLVLLTTVVCLAVGRIREHGEKELISAVIFALTLSIAALFMALLPGNLIARMWNFLTGSILLVTHLDLLIVSVISLVTCSLYTFFYREFLLISYDYEYALSTGIPARLLNYILSMLISLITIVCVYTVGLFVTYSILMIPGTLLSRARLRTNSMIVLSSAIVLLSLLTSVLLSSYVPVPPSGLCGIIVCVLSLVPYLARIIRT